MNNLLIIWFLACIFLLENIIYVEAFYGEIYSKIKFPTTYGSGNAAIGSDLYIIGGFDHILGSSSSTITKVSFFSNNSLSVQDVTPSNSSIIINSPFGAAYTLLDNRTIVIVGQEYDVIDRNDTIIPKGGLLFYDTVEGTLTPSSNTSILPPFRYQFTSAISPDKDWVYVFGGVEYINDTEIPATKIYKYNIKDRLTVIDITESYPETALAMIGGSANMLPDGKVVIAFGVDYDGDGGLPIDYRTDQVLIFDTVTNVLYPQAVKGTPPRQRMFSSGALGPDKTTLYYYGGFNSSEYYSSGDAIDKLVILNTITWEWVDIVVPGFATLPYGGGSLTLIESPESDKLVYTGGFLGRFVARSIGVVTNLPRSGQSLQSSNIRWFTNNEDIDNMSERKKNELSDGAKAGITIAVLAVVILGLIIAYKKVTPIRKGFIYIQNEIIWNPRSGEPLWAETSRLLFRFILLFLFLAFLTYLIIRAVNSPIVILEKSTVVDSVVVPDARFCFENYPEDAYVDCQLTNGTYCNEYVQKLDMTVHKPIYFEGFGNVSCYLFLPNGRLSLLSEENYPVGVSGTQVWFSLVSSIEANVTRAGIHVDFYPPGYNPNVPVYNLTTESIKNYQTQEDIRRWENDDLASNIVQNRYTIQRGSTANVIYDLYEKNSLVKTNGWNYIGLFTVTKKSLDLKTYYYQTLPNLDEEYGVYESLVIQPSAFRYNVNSETKVFTLLNAMAQAGGVLGLFIAIQAILFGFRPQSPWGIVHRWSFGSLRESLTNRLAEKFDRIGAPVPLVSPVNKRLSLLFNERKPFDPSNLNIAASAYADDKFSSEDRVKHVEERLQLMELVLKSYYLNDEIFKSIDQAVKRNGEVKRRSTLHTESDSILNDDSLNENLDLEAKGKNFNEQSSQNQPQRRPSSTVFPRDEYKPNLSHTNDYNYH